MTETEAWKLDRIRSARAGTNPTLLAKMPQSFAVIGDTQFLPGYCVLLVDDPSIDRLTDLPKWQRLEFLESMDTLGEAVETACRATDNGFRRMNYEILGNTDAYLHAHLFPRYEWEQSEHISRPVWLYDPEEFYGREAALAPRHVELRGRIVSELAKLETATWRRPHLAANRSWRCADVPP
jgi:diadenosine tetraphosphate (Ap4A) HIT family hydrolase